jgi:class 3 adenylate cyclase
VEPTTNYAKNGDSHIAFQTIGSGDRDLVYLAGIFSHLELQWDHPLYDRYLKRLASFTRLTTFDMRGAGLSDRSDQIPLLENQMDDLTAVLDRAGSSRTAVFGVSQAGPMAILYAASFPQRVDALILCGAYASSQARDDYPWGRDPDWVDHFLNQLDREWGRGTFLPHVAPSMVGDAAFETWWSRFERFSSSPGNAVAYARSHIQDDVREVLSAVSVPTLVIQRAGDIYRDAGQGQYIADHIPGAIYKEVPGRDHLPYVGDQDALLDEVEEFLTGVRSSEVSNRVLSTVLFTDIADSTKMAASMGDSRWHVLINDHIEEATVLISKHRGRLVDTAGDGLFAMFDGPARAVRCAIAIRDSAVPSGLRIRAGLHTGEVEVSNDNVAGLGVHIGARISAIAQPEEILVSRTLKDLVAGSGIEFEDRGNHELKGVPEPWQVFLVKSD